MWGTLLLLFVLVLSSCAGDELSDDPRPTPVEVCTTAFTPEEEAVVRSTVDPTASPVAFSWQAGDQLAVYAGGDASGLTNFDCVQVAGEDPRLRNSAPTVSISTRVPPTTPSIPTTQLRRTRRVLTSAMPAYGKLPTEPTITWEPATTSILSRPKHWTAANPPTHAST